MKIDLLHSAATLSGTPLAVASEHLEAFAALENGFAAKREAIQTELEADPSVNLMWAAAELPHVRGASVTKEGIAVIRVTGSLSRRSRSWHRDYGYMSYGALQETVEEALTHPKVKGVLLEIDSYGGEAQGCFDLAEAIRAASDQTGKPVWAHANEAACSAAYALACAAEKIQIARTGKAGAIGVIAAHFDMTGLNERMGVIVNVFKAGEAKDDANPHTGLSAEARERMQADVDDLHDQFCGLVAERRGLSVEDVKGQEARIYRGEKAVDAGLCDGVQTFRETLADLTAIVSAKPATPGQASAAPAANAAAEANADAETNAAAETEACGTGEGDKPETPSAETIMNTARVVGLIDLHQRTAAFGPTFDLRDAVSGGWDLDKARAEALNAAAAADENKLTGTHNVLSAETRTQSDIQAGWNAALENLNS